MSPATPNFVFVPYSYTVASAAISTGQSNQQPLVLDQDADFELHEIYGFSSQDAATDFRPNNFTVQITDKNNSRIWSSDQIAQVTIGTPPLTLRRPVLLAKRSNLNFNFAMVAAAVTTKICTVVLHGYKVYISRAPMPVQLPGV
jgi:hypothetical protein